MAIEGNPLKHLSALALASLLTFTAGCGGGGGGDDGGDSAFTNPPTTGGGSDIIENRVTGSVGDGPIVGARGVVRAVSGAEILSFSSDATASYDVTIKTQGKNYALTIEASGGTDLVTGGPPDFQLRAAIIRPSKRTIANLNPFTTLVFKSAVRAGGVTDTTVAAGLAAVLGRYNFGLDAGLISDPTETPIDDSNVAVMVKASETMGEMIRRTRDALAAAGSNLDGDGIMDALAADLVDGYIDGRGVAGASPRVAAVANVASAGVLIEAFASRLHVNGVDATAAMDQAIRQIRPSAGSAARTANVAIPENALAQAATALLGTTRISADPLVADAFAVVEATAPGTLPEAFEPQIAPETDQALADALITTAYATDDELEAINAVARGDDSGSAGNDGSGGGEPVPTYDPPTLTSVTVDGEMYTLQWTHPNHPVEGGYDVFIDGTDTNQTWRTSELTRTVGPLDSSLAHCFAVEAQYPSASEYPLSNEVCVDAQAAPAPPPNNPPSISGTPDTGATVGEPWSFTPQASDPDGDTLTFSVANRPAWLSFNSTTGRLSGTPADGDVGEHLGIRVSVSDGEATASLASFSIVVSRPASLGTATVHWTAPTQRVDGSTLTDLEGFRIKYGQAPDRLNTTVTVSNPGTSSYVVEGLAAGTWYFGVTAFDSQGLESGLSAIASKTIN
jgi:hypothetical protein